jgi:hypothetical protein
LVREVAVVQQHKEVQEGRVVLNIGGYRFETSVQALRRVSHTFFHAKFSGRYAQDVCEDGAIFVDRDGEHFGHVLEYMRDGVVSVAEAGASFLLGECLYAVGGQSQLSIVERVMMWLATCLRTVAYMLEGRKFCGSVTIGSVGPAEEQKLFDALVIKNTSSSR